ncbi:hypothetical protein WAI453_005691 [Rhynchosporium graminicola]
MGRNIESRVGKGVVLKTTLKKSFPPPNKGSLDLHNHTLLSSLQTPIFRIPSKPTPQDLPVKSGCASHPSRTELAEDPSTTSAHAIHAKRKFFI